MKRAFLLLFVTLLAGCEIIVNPTPTPTPPLTVLEADYATNYKTQDGTFVICDNRTTTLVYSFRYRGELESWTSYLEGQTLHEIKGKQTFYPDSEGVDPYEEQPGFKVTYTLGSQVAPYRNQPAAKLSPQAIVPVPNPTQIGSSVLHLVLSGADGETESYVFPPIPVMINCP